ncbi:MAG: hypothetical protein OXR73_32735, partial [Myxococcales bacterium]|nr:hypothetical protein [Myxococcales bacterium]
VGAPPGAAACGSYEGSRVTAGDPDTSLLMEKLEEAMPSCGGQMPPGGEPLPAEEIERIRSWIAAGAPNN